MTGPAVPPVVPAQNSPDTQALLNQIFNSSNWRGEIEKTVKKNVKLLDKNRKLIEALQKYGIDPEKLEITDGRIILTKEQAAEYAAFGELKLKPEEIKKLATEHGDYKVKAEAAEAEKRFTDAAEALDYENVPALTRWLVREKLQLEFKDQRVEIEDADGNVQKVLKPMPYVRPMDKKDAPLESLDEYIKREVPEFEEVFRTKPASEDGDSGDAAEGDETSDIVRRASLEAEERVRGGRKGGVRVPAARGARRDPAGGGDKKRLQEMEDESRATGMYNI